MRELKDWIYHRKEVAFSDLNSYDKSRLKRLIDIGEVVKARCWYSETFYTLSPKEQKIKNKWYNCC